MIGKTLHDRYLLEAELGRGGMGVVYKAMDMVLRRPVAVKLLIDQGLGTEGRARMLQEARTAASLSHANIIAIHDVGEVNLPGRHIIVPYIIMELVPGQTLKELKASSLEEIINIFDQVCSALEIAHERGVIHRDLKPENIIVTYSGTVKLMDFGLAQSPETPALGESDTISGTLAYMAPESILGQAATPKTDLYALGLVFYEYLTGRLPFDANNITALLSQRLHASIVPPSSYNDRIPPVLDSLIMRLLSRHPDDRPASANEVRQNLSSLASMLPMIELTSQPKSTVPSNQLGRLARGRLVGRENLFSQLVDTWRRVSAGAGQLFLISGEPGVGKTRLVRELATFVKLSGGEVLAADCHAEASLPFAPLSQVIGDVLMRPEQLAIPEATLADLVYLIPDTKLPQTSISRREFEDRKLEQAALADSVTTFFATLAAESPVLLFLDDLQWTDRATLSLLRQMAQRLPYLPLMIVGAYREAELDEQRPLRDWLADQRQDPWIARMQVPRLDRVRTQELLTTLFSADVSWDFVEAIYSQTEGNPFFIEEVCRTLVENGRVYFEKGQWHRPSLADLEIPQGLKMAILSRLRKFTSEERELIELAALLGREFQYDTLLVISKVDEEQLITLLDKAEKAQLIEEVEPSGSGQRAQITFAFTQALIHSTILTSFSTMRKRWLQQRVASTLENAYPDQLDQLAPLLGRYFLESGDNQKAAGYLLRAGDAAHRLYGYEEAIQYYEQALPLLEEQRDFARAAHAYMKLGLAHHNAFHFNRSRRAYEDGFALWQRIPAVIVPATEKAPHALRTHLRHLPTIDPTLATQVASNILIQQLFSGLVELNVEHEIIPDVALSWEVLEGGQKYIFHLRDDISWSDGHPVTAGDFEFAWKRILSPESKPYPAELLCDIKNARDYHEGRIEDPALVGVRTADDWTLIIDLEGPTSYFLHLLSQAVGMPVPRHVVESTGSAWTDPSNLVVNGPFTIKTWEQDKFVHLERNGRYHGLTSGNLQEVEVCLLGHSEDVWQLYQADNLDCLYLTPMFSPGRLEYARQHNPDQYLSGPTPSNIFLAFDVTRPPFDNRLVRQAIAAATDKDTLANVTLTGLFPPATGGFVPEGMPGHVPDIGWPYNLERARELLTNAGYPKGRGFPVLNARVLNANIYQVIARALQIMWRESLGIDIHFAPMPPAKGAQLILTGVAPDYLDPDTFLRANNWSPETGWHHPIFDQLVEEARRVADPDRRLAMYRQSELILAEEVALLPLTYSRFHMLLKPWVHKYPVSPLFIPYWRDAILKSN